MELLDRYGYSLVFVVALLEQLGLPVPVAPFLLLAGAIAASGKLSFLLLSIFTVIAAFTGDMVWFYLGRTRGRKVLKNLCLLSLSPETCVRKTEDSFLKYGMNSLLFSKFVPALNTIAPPMAGLVGARLISFVWRDLIGSILYVVSFLLLGFYFEKEIFQVTDIFDQLGKTFFWILIAGLALYVLSKYVKLKILQRLLYKERISVLELKERLDAGEDFIIVDIRANLRMDPNAGSIPGAVRQVPVWQNCFTTEDIERFDLCWVVMMPGLKQAFRLNH
jgi:membrane protein DedA with SNARE-associated domain